MSRKGWALFIAMSLIWGVPYLMIKIAVDELPPAAIVLGRTAIGAALLLPLAAMRDQLRPVLARWRMLVVFSVVEICIPWLMLGYAEQRISSSLTGLLVAAVPLVGAVMVKATGHETLSSRRVIGLLIGLAGVAALVGFDVGSSNAVAAGAVGIVAICYAAGPLILSKYLSDLPGLGVVAASLLVAALIYTPIGVVQWPGAVETDTWMSVVGLAVICTATAFIVFFRLIAEVGPARATVITYVNPVVALALGVLVLNETVSVFTGIGFALILVGSVLATSRDKAAKPQPPQERLAEA